MGKTRRGIHTAVAALGEWELSESIISFQLRVASTFVIPGAVNQDKGYEILLEIRC